MKSRCHTLTYGADDTPARGKDERYPVEDRQYSV